MISTRSAEPSDAQAMTDLLNEIIEVGGTTAHQQPYTPAKMQADYIDAETGISCVLAEKDGRIVGFQSLEWPYEGTDSLPENWAIIATFVKRGLTGSGIGKAMFLDTEMVAANSGVETIDATIRADNTGGLVYYEKMGFQDYKVTPDVPLDDGTLVDRISKRFDV